MTASIPDQQLASEEPASSEPRMHSWLGVASLVAAVFAITMACLFFGAIGLGLANSGEGSDNVLLFAWAFISLTTLACAAGLVTGIIALARPDRDKTFAIIGVAFSGLLMFMFCFLTAMAFGMLVIVFYRLPYYY